MVLPTPSLDDRRFQDLVDDAKRLVQNRCPEWTDHNVSDPGVTLIETFAYMTDQLLYRLNRVPDRLHVKLLELIGLRLLSPTAAVVPVTFWLSAPATTPLTVAAATRVGTLRTDTHPSIVFATEEDLQLAPRTLSAVRSSTDPEPDAPAETVDRTSLLSGSSGFPAFRNPPVVEDVLLVGLDDPAPRCAVRIDVEARAEGVGVNPDRPPLLWEAWTPHGWTECEVSLDETLGLNQSGAVVVHVPESHEASVVEGQRAGWLRARVVEPDEGQRPYTRSPVIHGLSACTVGGTTNAVHGEVVEHEVLGQSEGVPGQTFRLSRSPVLAGPAAPIVEVSSPDGWLQWQLVEHFADSTADQRHFLLDGVNGEIVFGPAVREADGSLRQYGAVVAKGATVRVRRYTIGGGRSGNVTAGAIQTLKSSIPFVSAVENRHPAQGGVDGESLEEAKARAPLLLRTRDRAVTAEDYEAVAKQAAPEVARVRCITAGVATDDAGTARLLVVPAAATSGSRIVFEDLVPRAETLARIAQRLEDVRVLGARLSVEPPLYRGITVVARLVARQRANIDRIKSEAEEALYAFISPLPGGGPDGAGWPFGRPVQSGDVYALLQRVGGVELVEDVRIFSADPVTGVRGDESRRINLDPNSLVFSFDHQILVEAH